jgi:hypothetical protein
MQSPRPPLPIWPRIIATLCFLVAFIILLVRFVLVPLLLPLGT